MAIAKPTNINEYILGYSPEIQPFLNAVRETIRCAIPEATETISYGMPGFRLNATSVWFAAHKNHIGLYAMYGMDKFEDEIQTYRGKGTKDTLQFSYNRPLPLELISKIVRHKFQISENE